MIKNNLFAPFVLHWQCFKANKNTHIAVKRDQPCRRIPHNPHPWHNA